MVAEKDFEPISLKSAFFASFAKCALAVYRYGCGHLSQNMLKNAPFKVLRSFNERKIAFRQRIRQKIYRRILRENSALSIYFPSLKPYWFKSFSAMRLTNGKKNAMIILWKIVTKSIKRLQKT